MPKSSSSEMTIAQIEVTIIRIAKAKEQLIESMARDLRTYGELQTGLDNIRQLLTDKKRDEAIKLLNQLCDKEYGLLCHCEYTGDVLDCIDPKRD